MIIQLEVTHEEAGILADGLAALAFYRPINLRQMVIARELVIRMSHLLRVVPNQIAAEPLTLGSTLLQ